MLDSKETLLRQQTALARFGEFALASEDLVAILQEACRQVCEGLRADFSKVVELQRDNITLLVRAGVGWSEGVVGQATSMATGDSFEGEALRTQEPVLCSEITNENASRVAPFVRGHGVKSFVNVNILSPAEGHSFGILEVDYCEPREFSRTDIDFLRSYANLIAAVVQRLRANAELQRRVEEKQQLLKELQHRIKNNLQILTSLVHFQSRRSTNATVRDELAKIAQRINALALVHDKLYAVAQVDRIELGGYISDIARSLLRMAEARPGLIRLATDTEPVEVAPELAITLGLIANEFVTNSIKYAFDQRGGTIGMEVKRIAPQAICLHLWDDGKGIPSGTAGGSGMGLIQTLARPLGGEIHWSTDAGVRLRLIVASADVR